MVRFFWAFGIVLWLGAIAFGMSKLIKYSMKEGASSRVVQNWPGHTQLQRSPSRLTLVLALHPFCPCSMATLAELNKIIAKASNHLSIKVLFIRSIFGEKEKVKEESSPLLKELKTLPGIEIIMDKEGREARLFGFTTSGHTALFSPGGKTLFTGGITPGRGHQGTSDGEIAILDFALRGKSSIHQAKVFGCSLFRLPVPLERSPNE